MNSFTARKKILTLVRNLYASSDNFIYPEMEISQFTYSSELEKTRLYIENDYMFDPANTTNVPAVFVGLGDTSVESIVLNDVSTFDSGNEDKYNTVKMTVPVVITHIARDPDEAILLATNTSAFFVAYRDMLTRESDIQDIRVAQVGYPKMVETNSPDRRFQSAVILQLVGNFTVVTSPEENILKKIDLQTLS
jgi:hypothetical protein